MEKSTINILDSLKKPKVLIETHGCKLNMADSQMLAKKFVENGYTLPSSDDITPNVFVLNSCTVTHVADRKARNALRKARKNFPNALIVAAGCYVERDENSVNNLDAVDISIGNSSKDLIVPSDPSITGRPSFLAVLLASTLSPIRFITSALGPMNFILFLVTISAKR